MNPAKELVTRAQEIFKDRGGAKQVLVDKNGNVCAMGALREAEDEMYEYYGNIYLPEIGEAYNNVTRTLDCIAAKTYSNEINYYASPIVAVNDQLGKEAVEHCYELAVKQLEEKIND